MKAFQYLLLLLICVSLIISCNQKSKKVGGPYYYESFASYQVPFKPIREISLASAKSREKEYAYIEAYFDTNGSIVKFTKYYLGKVDFSVSYTNRPDGSVESAKFVKSDGEIELQQFDSKGELIIPTKTP